MTILIDEKTSILVQGITGREASIFTNESLNYGAHIVAGVTPGKGGINIHNVPVYDTVAEALIHHNAIKATVISVPPRFLKDAALESIENKVPLIVIITERIPRKDIVEVIEAAKLYGCRIIGPNSLGIISPGKSRVGMCGGSADTVRLAYTPGPVGIMSRSGGMTTEIANILTNAGLGQSTCISIGGDPILGSTFLDLLPLYEKDNDTKALVIFGEPGSKMEEKLAAHIITNNSKLPIIAFIAGRFSDNIPGIRFGHAASIVEKGRGSPKTKIAKLKDAGIYVANKFSEIPILVKKVIS